ncbi:MAG: helix-turn-helix transcriptional regulator [Bacteroidota bacterium]
MFSNIILRVPKPLHSKFPYKLKYIGDHLLKHRLDNKKTQKAIARELGVSSNTVSNWENNKTHPGMHPLSKIIKLLGYDPLNPSENTLSCKIIAHRREKGLSQKKFAKLIGLDEETIIRLEKGGRAIQRTLDIVEDFLNQ